MKRSPVRGPVSLRQFEDINVLGLPVISINDDKTLQLPEAFFLHNGFHIVYVELKKNLDKEKSQFVIYDSWPQSSFSFRHFFTKRNLKTRKERVVGSSKAHNGSEINPVAERAVQRRPSSATCSLFAVSASLGIFFRPTVTDFWMWKVIYPILKKRPFPGVKVLRQLSNTFY